MLVLQLLSNVGRPRARGEGLAARWFVGSLTTLDLASLYCAPTGSCRVRNSFCLLDRYRARRRNRFCKFLPPSLV